MILPAALVAKLPYIDLFVFLAIPLFWWWLPKSKTTNVKRALFALGMVACWIAWNFGGAVGSNIVVVKIDKPGGPVQKTRGVLLFSETHTFGNGTTKRIGQITGDDLEKDFGTIVVNDSATPMRIDMIAYTSSPLLGGANNTKPVPPFSVVQWGTAIDDVGPDELPPEGMTSPIGMGARAWLTWGDADSDISFAEPRYGTDEWDAEADPGADASSPTNP